MPVLDQQAADRGVEQARPEEVARDRDGEEDRRPADRIHRLWLIRVGDQDPGFREGREERRVDGEDDEERDEAPDGAERTEEGGEEIIQEGHPPPQATREMRTIVTSKIKVRPFVGLL